MLMTSYLGKRFYHYATIQVKKPLKLKSFDRPTRLPLFASVISLPLEFGSNEDVLECKNGVATRPFL